MHKTHPYFKGRWIPHLNNNASADLHCAMVLLLLNPWLPQPRPSCIIQPAHVIGGIQADPFVDGLNCGHIARYEIAATHCHTHSICQQNHNIHSINDDHQQDAEMTQNYQQYHQGQARNQGDGDEEDFNGDDGGIDEDDPHFDALLRDININEIQAEAVHQHNLPHAHKTYTDPPECHSLGPMNVICHASRQVSSSCAYAL